jgi:pimeloyl-ACP methyl ester carboxylesterase
VHVLLIHGALGAAEQVAPLQTELGSSHLAHLVELEGHGQTPTDASGYEIDRFVRNVRDFMSARAIDRAAIFGYSMGGYVALKLAAEAPELVVSVATLGTKLAWTPEAAAKETRRLDANAIRAKVPKFAEMLERRHLGAGGWEGVLARTAGLMAGLGTNPELNSHTMSKIACPVRLMVGDRDAVVTIEETVAGARALAKGESAVLPNTTHPFEQVRLPLLATLLRDFLI